MAMDKRTILLDSIKKLLALKVPDNEILQNLIEIGVPTDEAKQLLADSKGQPLAEETAELKEDEKKPVEEEPESIQEIHTSEKNEELVSREDDPFGLGEKESGKNQDSEELIDEDKNLEEELEAIKTRRPRSPLIIDKPVRGKASAAKSHYAIPADSNVEKLWERGILTTINQKLNEMKALRDDLEKIMQKKLEAALQSELERIKIAFESQRSLMVYQAEEKLDEKFKEATLLIDEKISELGAAKAELKDASKFMEEERKRSKQSMKDYEDSMSQFRKTKDSLLAEMNVEIIKTKSNAQTAIDQAEEKIKEIDKRISKTLELQSSIAEGLLRDSEDKIGSMIDEKSEPVKAELAKLLQNIKKIKDEMEEGFNKKIELVENERQSESKKFLEEESKKIRELRNIFEKQLENRLEKLDKLYTALQKSAEKKKGK